MKQRIDEVKRMQKLAGLINENLSENREKTELIKQKIIQFWEENPNEDPRNGDEMVESGTEEWLNLLAIALEAYGIEIENPNVLINIEDNPELSNRLDNLRYEYVHDLENALTSLGIEVV